MIHRVGIRGISVLLLHSRSQTSSTYTLMPTLPKEVAGWLDEQRHKGHFAHPLQPLRTFPISAGRAGRPVPFAMLSRIEVAFADPAVAMEFKLRFG